MTPDELQKIKEMIEESTDRSIDKWFDKRFTVLGKWGATAISTFIFLALIALALKIDSWIKQ